MRYLDQRAALAELNARHRDERTALTVQQREDYNAMKESHRVEREALLAQYNSSQAQRGIASEVNHWRMQLRKLDPGVPFHMDQLSEDERVACTAAAESLGAAYTVGPAPDYTVRRAGQRAAPKIEPPEEDKEDPKLYSYD
jgi:hypothetical protein